MRRTSITSMCAAIAIGIATVPTVAAFGQSTSLIDHGITQTTIAFNQRTQRISHPNGCDYTRAGKAGERVWYLVLSTMGDKDCVRYFVEEQAAALSEPAATFQRYHYK